MVLSDSQGKSLSPSTSIAIVNNRPPPSVNRSLCTRGQHQNIGLKFLFLTPTKHVLSSYNGLGGIIRFQLYSYLFKYPHKAFVFMLEKVVFILVFLIFVCDTYCLVYIRRFSVQFCDKRRYYLKLRNVM